MISEWKIMNENWMKNYELKVKTKTWLKTKKKTEWKQKKEINYRIMNKRNLMIKKMNENINENEGISKWKQMKENEWQKNERIQWRKKINDNKLKRMIVKKNEWKNWIKKINKKYE